jgi:hypothetical protein
MNVDRLRVVIAALWSLFGISTILMVILCPILRHDGAIGQNQVLPIVTQVTGIWLPPLTCFCSFWFTDADFAPGGLGSNVSLERVAFAIGLTSVYMLILLCLLLFPLYWATYATDVTGQLAGGQDVSAQITDTTKYAALLSPLVLAPVGYLTRRPKN